MPTPTGTAEEQAAAAAAKAAEEQENATAQQQWKILGFASQEAYTLDLASKLATQTKSNSDAQAMIQVQAAELGKLRKGVATVEGQEEAGAATGEAAAAAAAATAAAAAAAAGKEVDPFKDKASKLYASLTEAERQQANEAIAKMPPEVRTLAAGGYEGKHALLAGLFPDKVAVVEEEAGGFFSEFEPKPEKKSITEQIALALSGGVVKAQPRQVGSGFKPGSIVNQQTVDPDAGRASEMGDISERGLYARASK